MTDDQMPVDKKAPNYVWARIGIGAIVFVLFALWALCAPVAKEVAEGQDDFVIAMFTILLVAVGAGQLGLFWWQLRLIRESLADTKLAALAANKSADATISMQRPWVKVTGAKIESNVTTTEHQINFAYRVAVRNVGSTPAIKTWITTETRYDPLELGSIIRVMGKQTQDFGDLQPGETLFPGDEFEFKGALFSSLPDDRDVDVLFCGIIEYEFGEHRVATGFAYHLNHHGTEARFLHRMAPDGDSFVSGFFELTKTKFMGNDAI